MPRTVKLNLLDLAMEVDPRQVDGTLHTSATICQSADGEKFPIQRMIDIYNQARMAFIQNMVALNRLDGTHFNGGTNKVATGTISYSAPTTTITKPQDFVALIALVNTNITRFCQIVVLPTALYGDVIGARNSHLVQSVAAKNVFLFNIGQTFTAADTALSSMSGDAYTLYYVGATLWATGDIAAGVETIEDTYWPLVKEIAVRIANNAGNAEIDALALSLIRGGK